MSRRARSRRDKRAPIPDFDDPQPRMPGLFHFWSTDARWIGLQWDRSGLNRLRPAWVARGLAGRD